MSIVTAVFHSFDRARPVWSGAFHSPIHVWSAASLSQVIPVVDQAELAAAHGHWVVLLLAYEAAPAFEPACAVHPPGDFPLAWAAAFDAPHALPPESSLNPFSVSPWSPAVSTDDYTKAIHAIHQYIAAGDTYQVNYTFPMASTVSGDSFAWFNQLGAAQCAPYSCYIDLGRYQVLSLSPELFFHRRGCHVASRPMKGTMPRGRWLEEDRSRADSLSASLKDRAENVMIVDLIRNDLGRIARFGSVLVPELFSVERYATVLQMTSTVSADIPAGCSLSGLFSALFPCGSITGAPKIRTMDIIKELEPFPRDIYTGAIGLIKPGGNCTFNVAIRTVLVDSSTRSACFHTGGGITIDSIPQMEYDECLTKSLFLASPPVTFSLLETMLLESGRLFLLNRHLKRMAASAEYFGFPFNPENVTLSLEDCSRSHPDGDWKLRLLLSPGGVPQCDISPLSLPDRPLNVALAAEPVSNRNTFLFHKTTLRDVYDSARAACPGFDDVILWNHSGEITESTIANVVVSIHGVWYTPPREAGLLAGTFRDELIEHGLIRERRILKSDLNSAQDVKLINSLRKWIPISLSL